MRNWKCLIVDDEPPARSILRGYVQMLPALQLVGECSSGLEALVLMQQQPVDILFLDVRMPRFSGIELVKTLHPRPAVVFISAHSEYAVDGFDLEVADYLLKPVSFERFVRTINRVTRPGAEGGLAAATAPEEPAESGFLYFRVDRKMKKVLLKDIVYIESLKDYIRIVNSDRPIVTKQSISSLERMLPEQQFIRIHRSYIVSKSRVTAYTSDFVELGREQLPIGRLFRQQVMKELQA